MRAELKGLPTELADAVAAHLMAAGELMDSDPALAYRHAEAARRRAARLPLVREVTAEAAYAAGLYAEALTQFKALRRIGGAADFLPVMVDCLRALGKYREALALADEGRAEVTDPAMQVELRIVEAGVRSDMGQPAEARRLLRHLVERPPAGVGRAAVARAWYAYAAAEEQAGQLDAARDGFDRAVALDVEGETAAAERLDALDGLVLELDEDGLDDEDEVEDAVEPEAAEEVDPGDTDSVEADESADEPETGADGDGVDTDEGLEAGEDSEVRDELETGADGDGVDTDEGLDAGEDDEASDELDTNDDTDAVDQTEASDVVDDGEDADGGV
jgi:tetratricopeptide (TPR) repeat protein